MVPDVEFAIGIEAALDGAGAAVVLRLAQIRDTDWQAMTRLRGDRPAWSSTPRAAWPGCRDRVPYLLPLEPPPR
ncbi:hypothetical protein OG535_39330 [Kitasatospora sp. NBC_00085]|uniref:hypothetical protein n=1 Tax=unclassified Kitasatospora TaxID=2633591 RepID=UPI0032491594